jgi:hypothetical protein
MIAWEELIMITKPTAKLLHRSLVGKQTHNLQSYSERELAAAVVNLATWEERMSARARLRDVGRFPPDKLGDRIDPYNEMIRAHRGRIAHTFDSHCKCACGVQEHDDEERRMRSGIYVWICRRCGRYLRDY